MERKAGEGICLGSKSNTFYSPVHPTGHLLSPCGGWITRLGARDIRVPWLPVLLVEMSQVGTWVFTLSCSSRRRFLSWRNFHHCPQYLDTGICGKWMGSQESSEVWGILSGGRGWEQTDTPPWEPWWIMKYSTRSCVHTRQGELCALSLRPALPPAARWRYRQRQHQPILEPDAPWVYVSVCLCSHGIQ